MKTAEEYWKAFPKHKPAKDADIAEAMREYAELYAQQRVSELEKENERLKNDLLDALDLKEGKGSTALSMLSNRVKELEVIITMLNT